MIEIEKTYLAKYFPLNLEKYESKEVVDIYISNETNHPNLRIRKNGNNFEITKKRPVKGNDASIQKEQTIPLTKKEFDFLEKITNKKTIKTRFFYPIKNGLAQFDVFKGKLKGLVLIDIEFKTKNIKNDFEMPDFCLTEVTQENFIAGGKLYGKSYKEIEKELKKFNYKKLYL